MDDLMTQKRTTAIMTATTENDYPHKRRKTVDNNDALHLAVHGGRWEESRVLLQRPDALSLVRHRDCDDQGPLMVACWRNAPLDVLRSMLSVHNNNNNNDTSMDNGGDDDDDDHNRNTNDDDHPAVQQDRYGGTPLHCACEYASEAVIALLLEVAPCTAAMADGDGCLPLHEAILFRRRPSIIKRLLKVHPTAVNNDLKYFTEIWEGAKLLSDEQVHVLDKEDESEMESCDNNTNNHDSNNNNNNNNNTLNDLTIFKETLMLLLMAYVHGTVEEEEEEDDAPSPATQPSQQQEHRHDHWLFHLLEALEISKDATVTSKCLRVLNKEMPVRCGVQTDDNGNFPLHLACSQTPCGQRRDGRNHPPTNNINQTGFYDDESNDYFSDDDDDDSVGYDDDDDDNVLELYGDEEEEEDNNENNDLPPALPMYRSRRHWSCSPTVLFDSVLLSNSGVLGAGSSSPRSSII